MSKQRWREWDECLEGIVAFLALSAKTMSDKKSLSNKDAKYFEEVNGIFKKLMDDIEDLRRRMT